MSEPQRTGWMAQAKPCAIKWLSFGIILIVYSRGTNALVEISDLGVHTILTQGWYIFVLKKTIKSKFVFHMICGSEFLIFYFSDVGKYFKRWFRSILLRKLGIVNLLEMPANHEGFINNFCLSCRNKNSKANKQENYKINYKTWILTVKVKLDVKEWMNRKERMQ